MINKIKKLLSNITEDYVSDKQARELAKDAYNRVLSSLGTLIFEGSGWKYYAELRGNISLYGVAMRLMPEDIGLVISSPYKNNVSTGGHWSNSVGTIWINPHIDIDSDKYWSNGVFDAEEYFSHLVYTFKNYTVREAFIHEYTHYLDSLKYKDPEAIYKKYKAYKDEEGRSPEDTKKEYDRYSTQPIEYNAFYQSFINSFEDDLVTKSLQRQLEIFDRYYNFRGYTDTFWDSLYNKYKHTDIRKKVDKRLYQFYINKKKELLYIEDNIEEFMIAEIKKLFNKTSESHIRHIMEYRMENPSLLELIVWICGRIPTIKNYISKYADYEKYYNHKYVDLISEIAKDYYPDLSEDIDTGLKNWHNETGWE